MVTSERLAARAFPGDLPVWLDWSAKPSLPWGLALRCAQSTLLSLAVPVRSVRTARGNLTPTTARCLFTSPEPCFLLAIYTFGANWHCVHGPTVPEMVADRIMPGLAIQESLNRYSRISMLTRSKQTHRGAERHCPWERSHNRSTLVSESGGAAHWERLNSCCKRTCHRKEHHGCYERTYRCQVQLQST
jgi:hypothetical protein